MLRRRFLQLAAVVTTPLLLGAGGKKRGKAHVRAIADTVSMRQTYCTVDRAPLEG